MDGILAWGLDVVRGAQTVASPAMTAAMKGVSLLGTEWFFLAALPFLYWSIDRKKGARLAVVFLLSAFLNLWLKDVFAQPRPFQLDPALGLASETSYGLPSGHSQATIVFWGEASRFLPGILGALVTAALSLLVGFSRIYLGVHFPTDVFAGWALGAILLAIDYGFGDRVAKTLGGLHGRFKALGITALALGMNALEMRDTSLSGVFFGAALGFAFVDERLPFAAKSGGLGKRGLRCLVGLLGAGVIYAGLKLVFPGEGSAQYALFRFVRYALLGAWVSIGAPWVFAKLRLVDIGDKARE